MESTIRKIFSGKIDDDVHNDLIKFGKGMFENRYLVEGKKQKDKTVVKTSAEFANYFVKACLEKEESEENIDIKGIIVSTFDISSEADFEIENVKKYMGIQQAVIRTSIKPRQILGLMDKYPRVFFGLSFKTKNCELKIKEKAPKSGKPASKGESGPKADFCSLKTNDEDILKDLFFDIKNFKEIKINHTIQIDKIIIPDGVKDPVELREKSIRKGKILRKIDKDGEQNENSAEFEV